MPQTPPFTGQLNTGGYNKNLYQTKEENYPGLYYHDNNLVSGSLEALIHHLVPTVDYYPDVSIVFVCLYHSFIPGGFFSFAVSSKIFPLFILSEKLWCFELRLSTKAAFAVSCLSLSLRTSEIRSF